MILETRVVTAAVLRPFKMPLKAVMLWNLGSKSASFTASSELRLCFEGKQKGVISEDPIAKEQLSRFGNCFKISHSKSPLVESRMSLKCLQFLIKIVLNALVTDQHSQDMLKISD